MMKQRPWQWQHELAMIGCSRETPRRWGERISSINTRSDSGEVRLYGDAGVKWIKRKRTSDKHQPIRALPGRWHQTLWPITAQFLRSRQYYASPSTAAVTHLSSCAFGYSCFRGGCAFNSSFHVRWIHTHPQQQQQQFGECFSSWQNAFSVASRGCDPVYLGFAGSGSAASQLYWMLTEVSVCVGSDHHAWYGYQSFGATRRDSGGRVWSHL